MKAKIHPEYVECEVVCGCGERFVTRATMPSIRVEVCSKCHPFYTGKQKLVDSAGRVEKFQRRWGKHIEETKARLSAEQSAEAPAAEPAQAEPVEPAPAEPQPAEAEAESAEPAEPQPAEAEAAEAEPTEAEPEETAQSDE